MTMHTPITSSATVRSGLGIFAFGLLTAAILSACGGGDGVYAPSSTTPTISNTTYVTSSSLATPTAVVTAGTLRYMIQGLLGDDAVSKESTTASALTYGANNAVIGIDNHLLSATSGTYAVQQFMGDATFAQGRWTKGLPTINGVVSSTPLTGTNTAALHYLVTRDMIAFPVDGTYPCGTDVRSTGLTYSGNNGGTVPNDTMLVGALLPDATITIASGVATLSVASIAVYAGVRPEIEPSQTLTFATPGSGPKYTGSYNVSGGEGIAYVLGEGPTADKITLGISFRRTMDSGPRYKGIASVICTKS